MTRLASRAARHAAQAMERADPRALEAARARQFPKLPRRGGVTALARAVVLEVRSGHADAAYALTRRLVEVAQISGRTA